jgi:predicted NACHT family NTPase
MADPVTSGLVAAAATQVSKGVLDGLAKRLADGLASLTVSAADQLAFTFRKGFSEYLETSYNKCRLFKTILNPSVPLELKKHYVHVLLTRSNRKLLDELLINELPALKCVVVTGLAGSGKSMFMRYLTVLRFENPNGTVPLFVELRRINSLTDKDLLTFIRGECTSRMSAISENQFRLALQAGAFLLILDGFDELNQEVKETIQKQILAIRKDFPATGIVLSSRPDERFGAWTEFHVFCVDELSKEQTTKLIDCLPYDSGVKRRFIRQVQDRLYDSHKSFLSSPLLATIMLLTFEGVCRDS